MGRYNVASNDRLLHSTFPARAGDSDEKLSRKISSRLSGPRSPLQKAISLEVPDLELFPTDTTTSISRNVELPPCYPSPSRHSTACCTSLADRQELQKLVANGGQLDQSAFNSFRSEDSRDRENLALWEEKEHNQVHPTTSGELGWLRQIGAQSPWRESVSQAVKKFETFSQGVGSNKQASRTPWKYSPNHAKSADAPRKSTDRKAGATSPWRDLMTGSAVRTNDAFSHEGLNSWYASSPGKCIIGELGSVNSPASASKMFRQSGISCELKPSSAVVANTEFEQFEVDHELCSRDADFQTVPDHVARFATEEDTRITSSAIAWDVSSKPDHLTEERQPRLLTGIAWELPIEQDMDSDHDNENTASESMEDHPEHPALSIEDGTRRPSSAIAWGTLNKSTEQSPTRAPGAVPFHWEDAPGKPKTIAAAAERALARQLSKGGMEGSANSLDRIRATKKSQSLDESMFTQMHASEAGPSRSTGDSSRAPQLEGECKGSQRFYSRTNLKERSQSSGRIETGAIDLIAPAAAKFLSDPSGSPVMTPIKKNPAAIPFNWEEAPGKPKAETAVTETYHKTLQLPPRLAAVPHQKQGRMLQESLTNYSVRHSMSAPLAGFNAAHVKIPSPSAALRQSGSPKVRRVICNLPPQVPSSFEALPAELNQSSTASVSVPAVVAVSKAAAMESFLLKSKSVNGTTRSPSRVLSGQLGGTPGDEGAEEKLRNSGFLIAHSSSQQKGNIPTSPTSILCGPDTGSQPSSNPSLSSNREMPLISATPTSHSNTNSTVSFDDSLEQDSEAPSPAHDLPSIFNAPKSSAGTTCPRSLPFRDFGPANSEVFSPQHSVGGAPSDGVKTLIKLCKSGSRWVKPKKQPKLCTISSPEIWAPTLATYYQCNESPNSSEQHDSPAPILSQKLDSAGVLCSMHCSATSSRLPYMLPSVEKQQIGTVEAPNPDFSARLGGRFSSSRFASEIEQCSGFSSNGRLNRAYMPASSLGREEEGNRSPAYAATLELLSPAHQTRPKKRKLAVKSRVRRVRRPKVRVRPRFLVSTCKTDGLLTWV